LQAEKVGVKIGKYVVEAFADDGSEAVYVP
jgi:hypothetical protein